jgi:hypothetical protein
MYLRLLQTADQAASADFAAHKELSKKRAELDHKVGTHVEQIQVISDTIRELMIREKPKKTNRLPRREKAANQEEKNSKSGASTFREFSKGGTLPGEHVHESTRGILHEHDCE